VDTSIVDSLPFDNRYDLLGLLKFLTVLVARPLPEGVVAEGIDRHLEVCEPAVPEGQMPPGRGELWTCGAMRHRRAGIELRQMPALADAVGQRRDVERADPVRYPSAIGVAIWSGHLDVTGE